MSASEWWDVWCEMWGRFCSRCGLKGWYPEVLNPDEPDPFNHDYGERYCDCANGARCRKRDGAP